MSLLERAKQLGDAVLMKELEALSGAPAGKKSATKANTGPDVTSVAQVLADVHVTAQGAVVVLAATPHPDADHGYVAGDDLWDFNNRVKWNQPWTDQVWLDQVTVDENDVDHFEPTYDVDVNRLLTHDGKGWTRTKLPKALPYGYVASTRRDLGAPWGLTGFGVSVLAFDGGPAHGRGKGPVLRAGGQGAEWAPRTAASRSPVTDSGRCSHTISHSPPTASPSALAVSTLARPNSARCHFRPA